MDCDVEAAKVQLNHVRSGGREIPRHTSSNPGHGPKGGWASTQGNGSQMDWLSDRKSPLDGLLKPINSRKKPTLYE